MTTETKIIIGVSLVAVLLLVGGAFLFGSKNPTSPTAPADTTILVRPQSHALTAASPSATLVEFGDYQCPACGAVHPLLKQLTDKNKDKLTFVFRNFPLSQHQNAQLAAEAAEAAGEQNKFWEMHDQLYQSQSQWSENTQAEDLFVTYAKALGLDADKFKQALDTHKFFATVKADQDDANTLGVNSTPTFYINSVKFTDSFDKLESAVSAALK